MLNKITEGTQNKFTLLCNRNNTNVCLNFVDFLRHNDGVGFTDLVLPHGFVVKVAVVLVAVPVDAAEQASAAAREARESNLLLAERASVLLLLSVFRLLLLLGSSSSRSGYSSSSAICGGNFRQFFLSDGSSRRGRGSCGYFSVFFPLMVLGSTLLLQSELGEHLLRSLLMVLLNF